MRKAGRVLLLGGSRGTPSRTHALLHSAARMVSAYGADPVEWRLCDANGPRPGGTVELCRVARDADALILVTPLYHGSYAGCLKHALDQFDPDHLRHKPVALMATGGVHCAQATDHLRAVVGAMRGVVIPSQVIASEADFTRTPDRYELTAPGQLERTRRMVRELLWFSERMDSGVGDIAGPADRDSMPAPTPDELSPDALPRPPAGPLAAPRPPMDTELSLGITRAVQYMRENFADSELSLDMAAREAHMSRSHFSRTFKAETGQRFIDYLTALRLHKATVMLRSTSKSVTDICHASGYRDLSHFERTFKAWFDVSPSQYRGRFLGDGSAGNGLGRSNGHRQRVGRAARMRQHWARRRTG